MSDFLSFVLMIYFIGWIVMGFLAIIDEGWDLVLLAPFWPLIYLRWVFFKIMGWI